MDSQTSVFVLHVYHLIPNLARGVRGWKMCNGELMRADWHTWIDMSQILGSRVSVPMLPQQRNNIIAKYFFCGWWCELPWQHPTSSQILVAELREWIHRIYNFSTIKITYDNRHYDYKIFRVSMTSRLWRMRIMDLHWFWRMQKSSISSIRSRHRRCSFSGSWTHPFCSLCAGGYPWDLALPGVVLLFWRRSHFRICWNSDRICNYCIINMRGLIMNNCWIHRIFFRNGMKSDN